MKLSQIIAYKNYIDEITPLNSTPLAYDILNPALKIVESSEIQFSHLTHRLRNTYQYVLQTLNDFDDTIEYIKAEIQKLIEQEEMVYYKKSLENYNLLKENETTEYIIERRLPVFDEVIGKLITRIQSLNDWHHAGMIIRPGHENWINYLVGCDPMYLVDQSIKLLEPAVLRFNDQYRRRLRTYVINESDNDSILSNLPDNQFGVCLVWNFFNYKPIEVIENYLNEIYTKLKPGGTLAMTFNNCDYAGGTELFERHYMSYTPGREIISRAESIGYIVTYNFRTDSSNTWLELQRPGKLTSIKGGQSLAKVVDIDDAFKYTDEEIKNIRQQAEELKIYNPNGNTPRVVDHIPISQLVKLIKQRKTQE
jgi:SAM-dependent methyltransferase